MPDMPPEPQPCLLLGGRASGPARELTTGDVLCLTRAASVQFMRPILVRVIRVLDWPTYDGWLWLDGYELGASGDAVARRSLFVMVGGLVWWDPPALAPTSRRTARRPVTHTPAQVVG